MPSLYELYALTKKPMQNEVPMPFAVVASEGLRLCGISGVVLVEHESSRRHIAKTNVMHPKTKKNTHNAKPNKSNQKPKNTM